MSTTDRTPGRIPADSIALAVTEVRYLAAVAECAVTLGDPTSDDSIGYAFGVTPVPAGIDATEDATETEVAAVRSIVLAALTAVGV
jgi:hypothetical protein